MKSFFIILFVISAVFEDAELISSPNLSAISHLLDPKEAYRLSTLGEDWRFPATSCEEIAKKKANATSGYYWVQGSQPPKKVFCNFKPEFDTSELGWMRIGLLNMSHQTQSCPRNFEIYPLSTKRLCRQTRVGKGCTSISYYSQGISWKQVCGRVIGYYDKTADGLRRIECPEPCTIDDPYVDGVSITHGNPRKHIWTFSSGQGLGSAIASNTIYGSNYFCESGSNGRPTKRLYLDDPLWDGDSCEPNLVAQGCCRPGVQWFCTELLEYTDDAIEVRVCRDQGRSDEDIPIELIELYVH